MEDLISKQELKAWLNAEIRFCELKNSRIMAAAYRKVLDQADKLEVYGGVNPIAMYFYGSSRE